MGAAEDESENERFERLIEAIEANTRANARLIQELQGKRRRANETKAQRARRVALEKPITVTPLVEAAAKRALARVKAR